jgi:hypothetical protein
MPDRRVLTLAFIGLASGGCGDRITDSSTEIIALTHVIELQSAESEYYTRTGRFGQLRELAIAETQQRAGPLSNEVVGGYRFEITVRFAPDSRYAIQARPVTYGRDGYRSFYADHLGSVHQTWRNEPATADSESVR